MAVEGPQPIHKTFSAGGTILQHTFVKLSANNTVIACDGVTDKPIGVAQEGASSGGAVNVCIAGITKIQGDADLDAGHSIGTSANAQAANYGASDTTKFIVGQVLIGNTTAAGLVTAAINCINSRALA